MCREQATKNLHICMQGSALLLMSGLAYLSRLPGMTTSKSDLVRPPLGLSLHVTSGIGEGN